MSTDTLDAPAGRAERRKGTRRRRPTLGARIAGVVGELLLTAGLLLGLFVVWQVYWTDVEVAGDQTAAIDEMRQQFEAPAVEEPVEPRTDAPPVMEPVGEGESLAILHVPRWGADYEVPIREGVGMWDVLNTGAAGHYPGTALPGDVGNFALAGHRQSYGAAFAHVDKLQNGDRIIVETAQAWLVYEVTDNYVVTPDEVDVVAPVPGDPAAAPTERMITFTTCHPLWSTRERWITHGQFVEWIPRGEGVPADLVEES
ncbi:class E sortase [Georgenia daeguensis]|uniref:Class E sortase n=1 Tax=Georgenia daeguensis TaxID=908355 RepID=A0ABP8ESA7_9MICO